MQTSICDMCGADGAEVRRVARLFGRGADMLVIQNVPMVHCPSCGESYYTSDTMQALDEARRNGRADARAVEIPVAEF